MLHDRGSVAVVLFYHLTMFLGTFSSRLTVQYLFVSLFRLFGTAFRLAR